MTTRSDEYRAFTRQIACEPDSINLRLIFADWLEDNCREGDAYWRKAKLIRHQVWMEDEEFADIDEYNKVFDELHRLTGDSKAIGTVRLRRDNRSRLLWNAFVVAEQWGKPFPRAPHNHYGDFSARGVVVRGAVEFMSMKLVTWLVHGPQLIKRNPVRAVQIVDRRPIRFGDHYGWAYRPGIDSLAIITASQNPTLLPTDPNDVSPVGFAVGSNTIPSDVARFDGKGVQADVVGKGIQANKGELELIGLLGKQWFNGWAPAEQWLSVRLIDWARDLAGLPVLPDDAIRLEFPYVKETEEDESRPSPGG